MNKIVFGGNCNMCIKYYEMHYKRWWVSVSSLSPTRHFLFVFVTVVLSVALLLKKLCLLIFFQSIAFVMQEGEKDRGDAVGECERGEEG